MLNGDIESIKNSGYIEKYPGQIGTIYVFAFIYKISGKTDFRLIQYLNIIANIVSIVFMYLILKILEKKYKASSIAYFIITFTFIPLILLTTYVYGDYLGLAFSIIGIYFVMSYKQKENIVKLLASGVFMSLAYFTKMNYVIVIIAIIIYLGLYLIQAKQKRQIIKAIVEIIVFAAMAILPFNIFKGYCSKKFEYDNNQAIPTSVWVYIGMNESYRANGWYSDYANEAWEDTPLAHTTYPQKIKERIKYLLKHPIYTIKFYYMKTVSGWMDPYFQSLWYNVGQEDKDKIMNEMLSSNQYKIGEIYQKAIIILVYGGSLISIAKNRTNLSNELILMLTIFVGGVLFHTIWEMKSRYTLPYVIMMMPVAAIGIQRLVDGIKLNKLKISKINYMKGTLKK